MLSLQLSAQGYRVISSCLTEKGRDELVKASGGRVTAILCDISDDAQVERFAAEARRISGGKLWALVNNAGIGGYSGLVDFTPMSDYRKVMAVNFFGHVAMTKALLPALLPKHADAGGQRGRVITIASVAGILGAPALSSYCASKYAVEGWMDSLRREMEPFGLRCVLLEPSFLATPIIANLAERSKAAWEALDPETKARWGDDFYAARARATGKIQKEAESPQLAVDALLHAVTSRVPRTRYRVGTRARLLYFPLSFMPTCVSDALVRRAQRSRVLPAFARETDKTA